MIPLIGLMYKSLNRHRADCMEALADSERRIVEWVSKESEEHEFSGIKCAGRMGIL